jgi:hypothetical protein
MSANPKLFAPMSTATAFTLWLDANCWSISA